jgi:hypothetical protein
VQWGKHTKLAKREREIERSPRELRRRRWEKEMRLQETIALREN